MSKTKTNIINNRLEKIINNDSKKNNHDIWEEKFNRKLLFLGQIFTDLIPTPECNEVSINGTTYHSLI